MIHIDQVIETCLTAIYSKDILSEKLFLKGGQALRLAHNLKSRLSRDVDFSTPSKIEEEDLYFTHFEESLKTEFSANGFHLFDFRYVRRPEKRDGDAPDFWAGWAVDFKLIEKEKADLSLSQLRREAIIPEESESSGILIDISEYEYCDSVDRITLGSVEIKSYSRVLLVLEKIRAICQQHPDYPHKRTAKNRARDYYDIERLYQKVLRDANKEQLLKEAAKHLEKVFKAKNADLQLLDKIFESSFYSLQEKGWEATKGTISERVDNFSYYNETLKGIVEELKQAMRAYE
ncbi:MAG: hypothetical protein EA369_05705 [Bradymonadales bacterium]|nr:MAG: hypothetical protein EA369_05705 [Bradymonadales bacterium]